MRRVNRNKVSNKERQSKKIPAFISIGLIIFVIMAGVFSANADVKRREAEAQVQNNLSMVSTSLNKKVAEEDKKYLTNELNKNDVSETNSNVNSDNGSIKNSAERNIFNNSNANNKINTATNSTSNSNKSTKENENYSDGSKSSKNNSVSTSSETTNSKSVKDKVNEILHKDDEKFIMPVDGEIYKNFSTDGLVYSDTLQEWITHKGIDIKAEKNTPVKATKSGKVKAIKNDPRLGTSVIIEHNGGFESVYACLLNADGIKVGDNVKQGDKIGEIGNSGVFEVADGSHLHFEILKDNENVNPELYF